MAKYNVYIPYNTFTEHTVEADSVEQAKEIAFNKSNVDGELLNNLEVDDEYVSIKETKKMKTCPKCSRSYLCCPECNKQYKHGTASHCTEKSCKSINAPLDCRCGFVASQNLDGVLDFEMNLLPYNSV